MTLWRPEAPPRLRYIRTKEEVASFDDLDLKHIDIDIPDGHYLACWSLDALLGEEDTRDNGEDDLVRWFQENEIAVVRFDLREHGGWTTGRPSIVYFAAVDYVKAVMIKLKFA